MSNKPNGPEVIMCECGKHARIQKSDGSFFAEVCSKEDAFEHLQLNALLAFSEELSLAESGVIRELVQKCSLPEKDDSLPLRLKLACALLSAELLTFGKDMPQAMAHKRLFGKSLETEQTVPKPSDSGQVYHRKRKKHRFR